MIVDYCHNAPGMKMLGDFVDRVGDSLESSHDLARPSRIGIIATAGDRRDEDMRELGHIAAQHFDVVVVREDEPLRGRERGEVAGFVAEGVRTAIAEGARCKQVEVVLDEIEAVRHAMARTNRGDLLVLCVDKHAAGDGRAGELQQPGPGRRPAPTRRRLPPTRTTTRRRPRAEVRILSLEGFPGRAIDAHGSKGFTVGRVRAHRRRPPGRRPARAGWGDRPSPAQGRQVLAVLVGDATVSGSYGDPVLIGPGQAAVWEPYEEHETWSETGLTALLVEGELDVASS